MRNQTRIFSEIEYNSGSSDDDLKEQLKKFTATLNQLNIDSPLTPRWAYEKARKGIKEGEADYEVDRKKYARAHNR